MFNVQPTRRGEYPSKTILRESWPKISGTAEETDTTNQFDGGDDELGFDACVNWPTLEINVPHSSNLEGLIRIRLMELRSTQTLTADWTVPYSTSSSSPNQSWAGEVQTGPDAG